MYSTAHTNDTHTDIPQTHSIPNNDVEMVCISNVYIKQHSIWVIC